MVHFGGHVGQEGVYQGQGGHGFDDYYGAGDDDGVVAAFDVDVDGGAGFRDGLLGGSDGRGGFEGCS